jgi:hypothetical protein
LLRHWWTSTFSKVIIEIVFYSEGEPLAKFFSTFGIAIMANPNAKPPKRKKTYSRNPQGAKGGKQKRSSYNFDAAREELGLSANANAQVIASRAIADDVDPLNPLPPAVKSPLKKEYKAMLREEREKSQNLAAKVENAEMQVKAKERKILSLKDDNKQLAEALRIEKEKSRVAVLKLMNDAELIIEEAHRIVFDAEEKMSAKELTIQKEKERMQDAVSKERDYVSVRESARKLQ